MKLTRLYTGKNSVEEFCLSNGETSEDMFKNIFGKISEQNKEKYYSLYWYIDSSEDCEADISDRIDITVAFLTGQEGISSYGIRPVNVKAYSHNGNVYISEQQYTEIFC